MTGKRGGVGRRGGSRAARSQVVDQQGDEQQKQQHQDEIEQQQQHEQKFDLHQEQLMAGGGANSAAEEEEDEDECRFLIGSQAEGPHEPLGRRSPQTRQSPGAIIIKGASNQMESRGGNLFKRLAGYLGPRKAHQRPSVNLDDISTSDFVYEQQQQHTRNATKHYYQSPLHAHNTNHLYQHSRSQTSSSTSSAFSSTRPLVLLALFLVLILSTSLLLLRLLSLVQDERGRLGVGVSNHAPAPAHTTQADQRQDSVLSDLSRKLDEAHQRQLEAERLSRWLVASSKCHIPVLDPWHESIGEYVRRKPALNCTRLLEEELAKEAQSISKEASKRSQKKHSKKPAGAAGPKMFTQTLTFVGRDNRLYFSERALAMGALRPQQGPHLPSGDVAMVAHVDPPTWPCCWRNITRKVEDDDGLERGELCAPLLAQGLSPCPTCALLEVSCPGWNYTNVHSMAVHNQEEEAALRRVAEAKLDPANHYNVLMLGVDTISRLNGMRQLNSTLATLHELYHTLEFPGYNKVGENTFPNLIPLLTGLKPSQLAEIQCWGAKNYTDESERADDYLDNCKYLWNYYQQLGYRTYYSEDWPAASTMNYLKPGFKNEPTTFYGRPFTLARDKLLWPRFEHIGCASCQLDRPIVEVDLDNLRSFIEHNPNQLPYFAFHWINCPQHDDLNGASQVDALLEQFLRDLHQEAHSSRTFVIFFSDHGYRWNDFVSTRIGHYESSLPLLTIAPPRHFIQNHPDLYAHLQAHQAALLTPFDLFKTLVQLRDLGAKTGAQAKTSSSSSSRVAKRQAVSPVGSTISLLSSLGALGSNQPTTSGPPLAAADLTTIAEVRLEDGTSYKQKFTTLSLLEEHSRGQLDRSCMEAGIPDNYCVCQQFAPVPANRTDVLGAAYFLVYGHLEARLRDHTRLCHSLDLESVHHAELYDFESSSSAGTSKPLTASARKRRQAVVVLDRASAALKTTPKPASGQPAEATTANKHNFLPSREFSLMFSTKPGGGLFQEVVRFYGDDMRACEREVERARRVVEDPWAQFEDKRAAVASMNGVCEFSVHSESLSRFNLYRDQSLCVTSNIELKKICYCNDLLHS